MLASMLFADAMPFAPLLAFPGARACGLDRGGTSPLPRVRETAEGWTVRASLPGLTAADVTVETRLSTEGAAAELLIHALPRLSERFVLSEDADVHRVRASLVNGELRIAVPRAPVAAPVTVAVAEGPLAEVDDVTEVLVPGVSAANLTLTVEERALKIEGRRSASHRALVRWLSLPTGANPAHITAAAEHGILRVHVPRPLPSSVAVDAGAALEPSEGEVALARFPCPGVPADRLAITLHAHRRRLQIEVTESGEEASTATGSQKRRRAAEYHVRVPEGVALSSVRAVARDGLLLVLARSPEPRAATAIPLDTATPAELPTVLAQDTAAGAEAAADEWKMAGADPSGGDA